MNRPLSSPNREIVGRSIGALNKVLEYDPTFAMPMMLKSYVLLEGCRTLTTRWSAAKMAVQVCPKNPDSQYTLG